MKSQGLQELLRREDGLFAEITGKGTNWGMGIDRSEPREVKCNPPELGGDEHARLGADGGARHLSGCARTHVLAPVHVPAQELPSHSARARRGLAHAALAMTPGQQ